MGTTVGGFHPVEEIILKTGFLPGDKIYISRTAGNRIQHLLQKAKKASVDVVTCDPEKLTRLFGSDRHQGIVLERFEEIKIPELTDDDIEKGGVFVVLESVQDPGNLGAIARSIAAFGASGIIISKHDSAPLGTSAMKSSAGAIVNIPVMHTGSRIASFLQSYKDDLDACIIGTVLDGEPMTSQAVTGILNQYKKIFLVFGSEQNGISRLVRERCHHLLTIPQKNTVQSLNVAQSATVFLYEFCSKTRD
jgi:23S rRNA (guanosine2251-2'-O)-methyltransferase